MATHAGHDHVHTEGCGHETLSHSDHRDFLHDGHMHHPTGDGGVDEHVLDIDDVHPAACTPDHRCTGHPDDHQHGQSCGHPAVPHGDHTGYVVEGHLHHPHGDHCDDHGSVAA